MTDSEDLRAAITKRLVLLNYERGKGWSGIEDFTKSMQAIVESALTKERQR